MWAHSLIVDPKKSQISCEEIRVDGLPQRGGGGDAVAGFGDLCVTCRCVTVSQLRSRCALESCIQELQKQRRDVIGWRIVVAVVGLQRTQPNVTNPSTTLKKEVQHIWHCFVTCTSDAQLKVKKIRARLRTYTVKRTRNKPAVYTLRRKWRYEATLPGPAFYSISGGLDQGTNSRCGRSPSTLASFHSLRKRRTGRPNLSWAVKMPNSFPSF